MLEDRPLPDPSRTGGSASPPRLVPILLLGRGGKVMLPGEEGPAEARTADGARVDLFDFTDYLSDRFRRIYLVDLGGVDHGRPQLDYLQEITRDTDVWVDAGLASPDAVIDILVAGARRAVVSTGRLEGPRALARAFRLTPELAVEIEVGPDGTVLGDPAWGVRPQAAAEAARSCGITELILSPRPGPVDWSLARSISEGGSLWIDGSFVAAEAPRLSDCGASGGFFHVADEIVPFSERERPGSSAR